MFYLYFYFYWIKRGWIIGPLLYLFVPTFEWLIVFVGHVLNPHTSIVATFHFLFSFIFFNFTLLGIFIGAIQDNIQVGKYETDQEPDHEK